MMTRRRLGLLAVSCAVLLGGAAGVVWRTWMTPGAPHMGKRIVLDTSNRQLSALGLDSSVDDPTVTDIGSLQLVFRDGRTICLSASYMAVFHEHGFISNIEIRSDLYRESDACKLALTLRKQLGLTPEIDKRILAWSSGKKEVSDGFGGEGENPCVSLGVWRGLAQDRWAVSITLYYSDSPH